jgi:hypothetical protein
MEKDHHFAEFFQKKHYAFLGNFKLPTSTSFHKACAAKKRNMLENLRNMSNRTCGYAIVNRTDKSSTVRFRRLQGVLYKEFVKFDINKTPKEPHEEMPDYVLPQIADARLAVNFLILFSVY